MLALVWCVYAQAQSEDFFSLELSSRISRNVDGEAEGLFHINYQPIAPEAIGQVGQVVSGVQKPSVGAVPRVRLLAENFLAQHSLTLGISGPENLDFLRADTDAHGGHHVRFARTYKGIRVDKMEILVHFDKQNQITSINGNIVRLPQDLRLAVDQHLSGGKPIATSSIALATVADEAGVLAESIIVHHNQVLIMQKAPYLVWAIDVVFQQSGLRYHYQVSDETSPRILYKDLAITF